MVSIPSADDMDQLTFCKHMNLRHMPLAGLARIPVRESAAYPATLAFHKREHELHPEKFDHNHLEES